MFCVGIFLFLLVVVFGDFVGMILMVVLVVVMIMVVIGVFDWYSVCLLMLKWMLKSEMFVMVVMVVFVLVMYNLVVGVVGGVLVVLVLFVWWVVYFVLVIWVLGEVGDVVMYVVEGELFFVLSNDLMMLFFYMEDFDCVVVDLLGLYVWDVLIVVVLDVIEMKYVGWGKVVEIVGMNDLSVMMYGWLMGGFE